MSVLLEAIQKIRGRRQEQAKSVWQQYSIMVDTLARGEQCDVDELGIVMDQLDKSDAELSADVDRKQKRIAAASRLEQFRQINARLPALEQTHEAAKEAYIAAVQKLQPKVEAAWEELSAVRTSLIQFAGAERDLLQSVDDPAIIDEQRDIDAQRDELAAELREIEPKVQTATSRINYERAALESLKTNIGRELERTTDIREGHRKRYADDRVNKAEDNVEAALSAARQITAHYEQLRAEMRELEVRQKALNERKLIP